MADIIQCKFCKKPFQSFGGHICHNCLKQIDEDFIKIRDYLYDNPGKSSVDEICEDTEVPKATVLHLLREKRLVISDLTGGGLTCEICNKPIASGTICDACKNSLAGTLAGSLAKKPIEPPKEKKPQGSVKSKMHVEHGKH